MGEKGVADAGGEAVDAVAVAGEIRLVEGPVFLHLLEGCPPLLAHIPLDGGIQSGAAFGVIEVAFLVLIHAQAGFQLAGLGLVVERLAKVVLNVGADGAVILHRKARPVEGGVEFLHLPAAVLRQMLGVAVAKGPYGRQFSLALFAAEEFKAAQTFFLLVIFWLVVTGDKAERGFQQSSGPIFQGGAVQVAGKFQSVQDFPLLGRQVVCLSQHPTVVGLLQPAQKRVCIFRHRQSQYRPGVMAPQGGECRPLGGFPQIGGILQPQPYHLFIGGLPGVSVKTLEEVCKGIRAKIFSDGADDAVPVPVCPAVLIVGLEVRFEGIVLRRVPDEVPRPALFVVQDLHQANTSPAERSSGRRVRITS